MGKAGALLLGALLTLTACAGADLEAPGHDPAPSTTALAPTGEPSETVTIDPGADRPLDRSVRHLLPATTDELRGDGASFALAGVYRIEPGIIAVVGVITPTSDLDPTTLTEPAYVRPDSADFSALTVSVPDDPRGYLPMRTDRGDCLCSPVQTVRGDGPTVVHALVAVPVEAQTVSVDLRGFGAVTSVPITDLADDVRRSGLGADLNIEVISAERAGGRIVVRVRLENPTGQSTQLPRGTYDAALIGSSGPCFRGLTVLGAQGRMVGVASELDCQRGYLPGGGRYVELTLTMGDPGGRNLVFLPSLGVPLDGVPWTGTPEQGNREVVEGRVRYRVGDIEVMEANRQRLRVPLRAVVRVPDEVAPALEESEPSASAGPSGLPSTGAPSASPDDAATDETPPPAVLTRTGPQVLDQIVETIGEASVQQVTVAVHAGGRGSATEWLIWARAQANLLVTELSDRLGPQWSVTGTGVGSVEPLVRLAETDPDRDRLRVNDRIEIRVGTPAD